MATQPTTSYVYAASLGFLAGMRSMTPPALVSTYLSSRQNAPLDGLLGSIIGSRNVASVFQLLAVGEMMADKFPNVPNRTFFPALLGRSGTAALTGAALSEASGEEPINGAVASAVAAIAATYITFYLRLTVQKVLPTPIAGLLEDVLLLGAGLYLLRRWHSSTEATAE